MKESFVFSEFIRRLNNIVRFGTVLEVDHKKARISQGSDLSLSVAIPSIYQNKFGVPSDSEHVVKLELSDKSSIEFNKENNEIAIKIEDSEITFDKDNLKAKVGEAGLDVQKDKIKLSVGSSLIEVTQGKISLRSPIIDAPSLKMGM